MRLQLVANVRREQSKLDGLLANVRECFPLLNVGLDLENFLSKDWRNSLPQDSHN